MPLTVELDRSSPVPLYFQLAQAIEAAIRDGEARLNGSGRILIRKSGTEPVIRVMAEGDDEGLVNAVVADIAGAITDAARLETAS